MLGDINVHATVPVSDLDAAKDFYENTLGLEEVGERDGGAALFRSGDSHVLLYESEYVGTNQATALSWEVNDPKAIVDALKEKGVEFEHYPELPGVTLEGDMHRMGATIAAWFKDPDGNILAIGSAM
jgi:catechol 2,3-dioxygenase-like lactoylglutathione lyase family enzyme